MVRIALGEPDRRYARVSEGFEEDVWAYTAAGPGPVLPGGYDGPGSPPEMKGAPRIYERTRVIFRGGVVFKVEQPSAPGEPSPSGV